MTDGPVVGYATLPVIPSMRGIKSRLRRELNAPLEKAGQDAGEKSSRKFAGKFVAGIATAGAAAGAALIKGVTDAFGEEDVAATIQSQLGIDPAVAGELADTAAGIYRNAWGDSLSEVGGAIAAAESSLGDAFGATGIDGATTKALAFAQVFDSDVNEAISSAGQLLETGLATDADNAFDLLTRASQKVPAAIRGEVLEASNEYGRFFSQLGLTGAESFQLLADAAEGGVFGIDKTGDALKELTIRATDMSTTSKDAFKAAGLNIEDMAAQFLAGGDDARDALDQTVRGLLSIEDPTKRAKAAIGLFGTPLEDLGTEQIPDFLLSLAGMEGGLEGVQGAADRMVDAVGSTRSAKIEAFRRKALGRLADFTADVLIPAFESFADWTRRNWPAIRQVIEDSVGRAISIFQDLREAVGRTIGWLNDNRPVLFGIAAVFGTVLVTAVAAWTVATWAQVAALWAQAAAFAAAYAPVVAAALAIGALTAGVVWAYQNWDFFRESVDGVAGFLRDKVPPAFRAVVRAVRSAWRWMQNLWDRTDGFRSFMASAFMTGLGIASDAVGGLRSAFETAWTWAQKIWDRTEGLRGFMADAFMAGIDIGTGAVGGLRTAIETAWRWAKTFWDRTEGVRAFLVGAFKLGFETAETVIGGVKTAFEGVRDAVGWVVDKIEDLLEWIDKIPSSIPNPFDWSLPDLTPGFDLPDLTPGFDVPGIPGFSGGGRTPTDRPFWVGEEGPELMMLRTPGHVMPNDESMRLARRRGDGQINVTVINRRSSAGPGEVSRGIRMARMAS